MKVIGLTGLSGAGKGAFSLILSTFGIPSIDTDKTSRLVVEKGKPCLDELVAHFGKRILSRDGTLDRKALGNIVFSDPEELLVLNSITHKYITYEVEKALAAFREKDLPAAIIDAPLLFESGENEICDVTVGIAANRETRLKRITERDGITREYAEKRINSQKDESFFFENCDYIIYNDAGLDELKEKAVTFLKKYEIL